MANSYWIEQEKKFLKAIKNVEIPNANLDKVDNIIVKTADDLSIISAGGGCYWIWTNEPVLHTLHKHKLPSNIGKGHIIYNGIAKDDVRGRIFCHLFGFEDATWSGISMDIYKKTSTSHRKKAMSDKGKVPYVVMQKEVKRTYNKKSVKREDIINMFSGIRSKELLLTLHLSQTEKDYINNTSKTIYYFRNGINIKEDKHKNNKFKVYFITGLSSLYLEYIEKEWRKNGLPRLCSYSTGR
jgi:hypothetical protein